MNAFKPFVLGSLLTLATGAALFGNAAHAEQPQQTKTVSSHLVTLGYDGAEYHISADLVDLVTTWETEANMVELKVFSINDYSGEEQEICSITVPKKLAQDFVKEVNRFRP